MAPGVTMLEVVGLRIASDGITMVMVSAGVFVLLLRKNMNPIRIKGGSWFSRTDYCCSDDDPRSTPQAFSTDILGFRIIIKEKDMSLVKTKGGSWGSLACFCRSVFRGGGRGISLPSRGFRIVIKEKKMSLVKAKGGSWYSLAMTCCSAFRGWGGRSIPLISRGFRIIVVKEKNMDPVKVKGGSWLNIAVHCRSGLRFRTNPNNSNYILGFRTLIKTLFTKPTTSPSTLSFDFLPGFTGIAHPSKFPGAYMGDTPITQKQWKAIVEMFPDSDLELHPSMFMGDLRPVESVTYEEVTKWIEMLNLVLEEHGYEASLPTEEEWMAWAGDGEYATVSGKISPELACYDRRSDEGTTPVKSFPPNPLGMYDMAGNVYEFVI